MSRPGTRDLEARAYVTAALMLALIVAATAIGRVW